MKHLIIIGLLMGAFGVSFAQNDTLSWQYQTQTRYSTALGGSSFSLGGYYRFYGINRTLEQPFRVLPDNQFANTPPFILGVGDVYIDPPIMLMTASIRAGGGAAINMDYALFNNIGGTPGQVPYNLNLGISLYGTVPTDFARFGFQLGGIHWTDVSGMVFSSFVGYNRFSIFERWAWEGLGQGEKRAENYLEKGDIARESRWARQAFKGALVDVDELPYNLSARVLFGKTPATAALGIVNSNYTTGGRLRYSFSGGDVSFNTMNYVVYTDSIGLERGGINLHTLSAGKKTDKWEIAFEGGIGQLVSATQHEGFGEALRLKLRAEDLIPFMPLEVEVFRISPQFVNFYGNFISFNTQIVGTGQAQVINGGGGASNFVGSITDVGQVLNNREGFTLNGWLGKKNTRINFGTMVSRELERATNRLSFGHKINGLALSRFAPFASGIGPYGRWTSFYRGVAEDLFITDTDTSGLPPARLTFNNVQFQLKQRIPIGKQSMYAIYLGSYGSVAAKFTPIPVFNDEAYLRAQYHEFDVIVPVTDWFCIDLSAGYERIVANDQTNNIYYIDSDGNLAGAKVTSTSDNFADYGLDGTPISGSNYAGTTSVAAGFINQTSTTLGIGCDIALSAQSGLYIRHKRYTQEDANFLEDKIRGTETTIELKIFF